MKNITVETNSSSHINISRYYWRDQPSNITNGVFLFTSVLSFLGNLLVLILFLRNKKWLQKTYGRIIFALAIVDILTAICLFAMPMAIHEEEQMRIPREKLAREMYCRLIWSHYILFSFGVTSVYTCLVLAVERWVAVAKPFYVRKYKPSRGTLLGLLALPWLAGFSLEANVVNETSVENYDDGSFSCKWGASESMGSTTSSALAIISFLGAMFIPALLIVLMYAHILIKLRHENTRRQISCQAQAPVSAFYKLAFRRATKMAACATIAVVICWLPCQTYSMLAQLGNVETETTLHRMLNLLAFFNSCLNPFIYAFSNALFRKKFTDTFARFKCQNPPSNDSPSVFV